MSIKLKLSQLSQKKKKKKKEVLKRRVNALKWLTAQGRKFTAKG